MKRITYPWLVGLCVAWLWLPAMSSAAETKLPDPLPIETMKAAVYTKAFAKRFVLPDPEPGTEPSGAIQGMEFSMEEIPPGSVYARPLYACDLILYLDNTLPIAWPEEGRAGAQRIMSIHPQLFSHMNRERFLAMSVEDRRHSGERISRYRRLAWLAVPDTEASKGGGLSDATYSEYDREFYPGIAYIKLDIGCSYTAQAIDSALQHYPTVSVWLKRVGGKDYRKAFVKGSEDFLQIALPRNFIERILPWIKAGRDYNKIVLMEETQRNRPQRMKEAEQQMKEWDKELADPAVRRELGEFLQRKK